MTATTKFLAGSAFNLMARGTLYSSDQKTGFPREQIADGYPSQQFRFSGLHEDGWVKVDLSQVANGDFEGGFTGTIPNEWTDASTGGGAISAEQFVVHGGARALLCSCSATLGEGAVTQELTVRSGELRQLNLWMMSRFNGGVAWVQIYNQATGHYVRADGVWQDGPADCQTESSSVEYVQHRFTYTVEDFEDCQADTVILTLKLYCSTTSASAVFDDVADYASVDIASVHGHNLPPAIKFAWFESDDDAAYTQIRRATTPYQPSFYVVDPDYPGRKVYRRWIKFVFSGTPRTAIRIGELVLGQAQTLTTDAQHPAHGAWVWDYARPQILNVSAVGERFPINLTDHRQRVLRMPYFQKTDESFIQFRDEIRGRCQDGAHPIVIVPDNSKPDVIFGRVPAEWSDRQGAMPDAHQTELMVIESPFGIAGL